MDKSKLIKSIVKKTVDMTPKFGTDPRDPWSVKSNINETALLDRYLSSRGINPKYATKDMKVAHSKTSQFKNWLQSHIDDSVRGMKEEVDKADRVMLDIPFLIRLLEFAREDAKTDMELHKVVQKLISIRNKGVLTMDDYDFVVKLKEELEITDLMIEQMEKDPAKRAWQTLGQKRSEIWRRKRLKIDEVSQQTKDSYKEKATAQVKELKPHTKGEYGDIVKRMIQRREKGLARVKEEVEQLDELQKSTLTSYATKARADAEKLTKQGDAASKRTSAKSMQTALDKFRKATKRHMGAASAESKARIKEEIESVEEDLRKWFSKTHPEGGWKRINSKGEAIGPCAREPGEPKPKCMSNEKRAKLSKKERASAVAAKRKHDPVADRSGKGGKPVNVSNFGKGKISEEQLDEKNSPTNPKLWARAKSMARSKFDVYPSAYANGWASKWYKSKGGGWRATKEETEIKEDKFQDPYAATQTVGMEVDTDSTPKMKNEKTKSARIIKSIYKKKGIKEDLYDHEKDDKSVASYGKTKMQKNGNVSADGSGIKAAAVLSGGKTMTGEKRDTIEIDPIMRLRPGQVDQLKK
jgi:hypothetical protein